MQYLRGWSPETADRVPEVTHQGAEREAWRVRPCPAQDWSTVLPLLYLGLHLKKSSFEFFNYFGTMIALLESTTFAGNSKNTLLQTVYPAGHLCVIVRLLLKLIRKILSIKKTKLHSDYNHPFFSKLAISIYRMKLLLITTGIKTGIVYSPQIWCVCMCVCVHTWDWRCLILFVLLRSKLNGLLYFCRGHLSVP